MTLKIDNSSVRSEYRFKAMGGEFQLLCFPQPYLSTDKVMCLFHEAEKEVARIQNKLSDFIDSPFNQINKNAGKSPVKVDHEIWDLVKKSLEISNESRGIFDISFASIGHQWREAIKRGRSLTELERSKGQALIDYRRIKLNPSNKSIYLPHEKMRIGLGGIGKGYAVDCVFEFLKKKAMINFYVNGAGDIRVHSHKCAPRPWRIGIRNPLAKDSSKSIGVIQMSNGSVASSGGYINFNQLEKNRSDHHIINPYSGHSNDEIISATVIADDAITSDTTATILMSLNSRDAISYLNDHHQIGFIIDKKGRTSLSKTAHDYFGL